MGLGVGRVRTSMRPWALLWGEEMAEYEKEGEEEEGEGPLLLALALELVERFFS